MTHLVTGTLEDGLATITLNRPEAGNAMSWELIDGFSHVVERLTGTPGVRAVLIRAEGKNFCVGGDIRSFASESDPAGFIERLARRLHEGLALLAQHPAPIIVAAQGASAGAGLSLVASGDVVLVGRSASFAMAYTGIGLTADGGATWLLPRLIGLRATQEMAYLGRRLDAAEAVDLGLATRAIADETLTEEAAAIATRIAAGPTGAFGGVKRLLAQSYVTSLPNHLDAEATAIGVAMAGADAREGVAAFLERRKATYHGV
ncbi:enoyl-CoA hydratase/isomerase family protein [Sphingobium cupriresistens]|uniref:Enoyl-CoA hydratase n=1 Tax=Sphingobium cupriresistens LL01 TaxID=1420583 RepID=A0A0J7XNP9_9SPHN|nr:enoyl-CoA hydratase/isomerase family protein [Sphingobium cupriresistens]KMS53302.1 enoyl-CoA hydratase [Sphingobium cupriresistens LL01]